MSTQKSVEYDDLLSTYFRNVSRYELLTRKQERELGQRKDEGPDAQGAFQDMVNANLRLVASVAKRFMYSGLPFIDIIAEGNIALIHAVEVFDYRRGYPFAALGVPFIRNHIIGAIARNGNGMVRGGKILGREYKELYSWNQLYRETHGGVDAPAQWLAEHTGFKPIVVERFLTSTQRNVSLDTLVNDGTPLYELFPGNSSRTDSFVEQADLSDSLSKLKAMLTPREQYVIQAYHGFNGGDAQTLQKIGDELGLTRELVRQIKERAYRKMRGVAEKQGLKDYL